MNMVIISVLTFLGLMGFVGTASADTYRVEVGSLTGSVFTREALTIKSLTVKVEMVHLWTYATGSVPSRKAKTKFNIDETKTEASFISKPTGFSKWYLGQGGLLNCYVVLVVKAKAADGELLVGEKYLSTSKNNCLSEEEATLDAQQELSRPLEVKIETISHSGERYLRFE